MLPAVFVGRGIKCYQCISLKSWDGCIPENDTECASGLDSCVKFEVDGESQGVSTKAFYKGCALKSACNDDICKAQAPSVTIKKCDVSCCQSDLCNEVNEVNEAKVPIVSSFLFLTCALVAFFP